jgi:hypothetical protein
MADLRPLRYLERVNTPSRQHPRGEENSDKGSTQTVGAVLDQIRDYYLKRLRDALREAREEEGARVIVEPAYRLKDGTLTREGPNSLPLRGDLFTGKEMIRVDTKRMLSFEPLRWQWEGALGIQMFPFKWNECRFQIPEVAQRSDWSPLLRWFAKWFDEDDNGKPGKDGLFGVVHFLSDPTPQKDGIEFDVDFGSAPVQAFEGILDAMVAMGTRLVIVGAQGATQSA